MRHVVYQANDQQVKIINIRVSVVGKREKKQMIVPKIGSGQDPLIGNRLVYLEDGETPVKTSIYDRNRMKSGYELSGPAIIQEYACTTILFPGDKAIVTESGEIEISINNRAES